MSHNNSRRNDFRTASITLRLLAYLLLVTVFTGTLAAETLPGPDQTGLETTGRLLERELFLESADGSVVLEPVDSAVVIRQRPVDIQFDVFTEDSGEAGFLVLNLFDDVDYKAILERIERSPTGGVAWIGYLDGVADSAVTLVIDDQKLSGTVTLLGSLLYQIRHTEQENGYLPQHVILEVDTVALRSSKEAATQLREALGVTSLSNEELRVFELVNHERATRGLHQLSADSRLIAAARSHSNDMSQNNYFSHTGLDGRSAGRRIQDSGYSWNSYGENIANGYSTPEAVMNAWMNSSGHRRNILSQNFCDIGVGHALKTRHFWTLDFGRERGVSACPNANDDPGDGDVSSDDPSCQ